MTEQQKNEIAKLLAAEHVAYFTTMGEESPTATIEAFAETPDFKIILIMNEQSERFQNIKKRPNVAFLVAHRYGEVSKFEITRLSGRGIANEVQKGSAEWDQMKAIFLKKNPFEEPFFGNPGLRMLLIKPKTLKYAHGLNPPFTVEL